MRTSVLDLIVLSALTCCNHKPREGADGDARAAQPSASSSASPSAATPPSDETPLWTAVSKIDPKTKAPWIDEAGRQGRCKFVKWDGSGKERKSIFELAAPPGKQAEGMQTWQFYYDKSGEQIDSYPSATSVSFNDDAHQQALGQSGDGIKKDVDTVECEITRITFADGTFWFNANLMKAGLSRPKGGFTHAQLLEHTGEKVAVTVVDGNKGKVKLVNLTDAPVKSVRVDLFYSKPKGQGTQAESGFVDVAIDPKGTATAAIKVDGKRVAGFESVDGAASSVDFTDGTSFSNRNLDSYERP